MQVAADAPDYLRWLSRHHGDGDLRPYLRCAVCELVESICGYEHLPVRLDRDMVDRVDDPVLHPGRRNRQRALRR